MLEENKKNSDNGPGILIVEGKHKFRLNKANKSKSVYTMFCVQYMNSEFFCKAKVTVLKKSDNTFFLYCCDKEITT